jgi:hypothetical protein
MIGPHQGHEIADLLGEAGLDVVGAKIFALIEAVRREFRRLLAGKLS